MLWVKSSLMFFLSCYRSIDKDNLNEVLLSTSPNFLKPKPLNLRKEKKRIFRIPNKPLQEVNANIEDATIDFLIKSPKRTLNPFRCLENKRKRELEDEGTSDSLLSKWTNNKVKTLPSLVIPEILDENAHCEFGNHLKNFPWLSTETKEAPERTKHKSIPVDWSLKAKIRLTSPKSFPWRTSFKTSEEASGITGFLRCLYSDKKSTKQCSLDTSYGAKFYQQTLVWMHPSLPWLNLFPRSDKSTKNNLITSALDVTIQENLHSKWCDSFRSLYQLVRTYQCPYFYLCAPRFTVLFRSSGVASILDIHALICPTSKGLRKALADDGVNFTLPLSNSKDSDSLTDKLIDENSQLGLEDIEIDENCTPEEQEQSILEDDAPEIWLESLGQSQDDFPSPTKRKTQKKKIKIDHKPESLVYVEGTETQALVNFLLNYSGCTSKIGYMAGIPPTLLSPTGFLGATLHYSKIRHGKVQKGNKQLDTVELVGPLLPNTIHSLCSLFNMSQEGTFSATLTTHAPTSAFSKLVTNSSAVPSVFATENLKDCGLPKSFIEHMCSKNDYESELTTIQAEDGMFTWT